MRQRRFCASPRQMAAVRQSKYGDAVSQRHSTRERPGSLARGDCLRVLAGAEWTARLRSGEESERPRLSIKAREWTSPRGRSRARASCCSSIGSTTIDCSNPTEYSVAIFTTIFPCRRREFSSATPGGSTRSPDFGSKERRCAIFVSSRVLNFASSMVCPRGLPISPSFRSRRAALTHCGRFFGAARNENFPPSAT
jgi:hypothetical protein